jgi:hypothetical protein
MAVLLAAVFALVGVPDASAKTCQELLGSSGFDCEVVNEVGAEFQACITTSPAGDEVDMTFAQIGGETWTGKCSCDAKGTVSNPKFDLAKTFLCALDSAVLGPLAMSAKATSNGIANGRQTLGSTGLSYRLQCARRASPCP